MNDSKDENRESAGVLMVVFFAGLVLSLCFAGPVLKSSEQLTPDKIAKLNPNIACAAHIAELPSIGPKKAQAIIDCRTDTNGFECAEDLEKVKGIGEKTIEKIKLWLEFD